MSSRNRRKRAYAAMQDFVQSITAFDIEDNQTNNSSLPEEYEVEGNPMSHSALSEDIPVSTIGISDVESIPVDHFSDSSLKSDYSEYSSSEVSDDEVNCNETSLSDDLYAFYLMFNVPVAGMKFLLSSLKRHGVDGAPDSLYKLRKEHHPETRVAVCELESGLFSYIGIKENLAFHLRRQKSFDNKELSLDMKVNIDGLPLYNSSTTCIWPILVSFGNDRQPYPVALHLGKKKPVLNSYLQNFIDEIQELRSVGCFVNDVHVKLDTINFVCDAPARAYLQAILGHTAKKGCPYCDAEGQFVIDRIAFPSIMGNPRTDDRYARMEENNQVKLSPLVSIVGLKTNFPIDELHCVCLGVFRKMCHLLFSKVKNVKVSCRVKEADIDSLSSDILKFRKCTPSDFQRMIRSIKSDLAHYKGTEFRTLLLYFGPFLFKKYLSKKVYDLVMLLHFSYFVFSSDLYSDYFLQAHRCLEIFVNEFALIFGKQIVSYNVHMLLHLYEFVRLYGPLKNYSTFAFENYLGRLKRRVKVTRYTFSHIMEQIRNLRTTSNAAPCKLNYSTVAPNNIAVIGNHFVKIDSIFPDGTVSGKVLVFRDDLFSYPYQSRVLSIGYYALTKRGIKGKPINKAIAFPFQEELLVFPLV